MIREIEKLLWKHCGIKKATRKTVVKNPGTICERVQMIYQNGHYIAEKNRGRDEYNITPNIAAGLEEQKKFIDGIVDVLKKYYRIQYITGTEILIIKNH